MAFLYQPAISYRLFCVRLPANLFDIEVLDDQNIQLQQFAGSAEGTRIENLQAGTYKVNEIKKPDLPSLSQLTVDPEIKQQCGIQGFPDGGRVDTLILQLHITIHWQVCIKYEDEQGNDCSILTLAPEEEKTVRSKIT